MPELPEVETVARALDASLAGAKIHSLHSLGKLRLPVDGTHLSRLLAGQTVRCVRRRGKYLVFDLTGRRAVVAHLGMTGAFRVEPAEAERQHHDRVEILLADSRAVRFSDQRRFGFITGHLLDKDQSDPGSLAGLGVEPLEKEFSGKHIMALARSRKCPVKPFLMDQSVVAGVGNIYASEALFAAGIDPRRPAQSLKNDEWPAVVREVKKILRKAIKAGGSSVRNYRHVDGNEGFFQRRLAVYGRAGQACPKCGEAILSVRQAGRSTFFCPTCQA